MRFYWKKIIIMMVGAAAHQEGGDVKMERMPDR